MRRRVLLNLRDTFYFSLLFPAEAFCFGAIYICWILLHLTYSNPKLLILHTITYAPGSPRFFVLIRYIWNVFNRKARTTAECFFFMQSVIFLRRVSFPRPLYPPFLLCPLFPPTSVTHDIETIMIFGERKVKKGRRRGGKYR